jgi:hypothetical protein
MAMSKEAASEGKRTTVMTIKGTVEWKAWLDRLAEFSRLPSTILIDLALAEWAKNHGFPELPPKRQVR